MATKEEKVEAEVKKAKVSTVRKKAEDLPEIPDYERPELEVYEASDFTPSTRDKPEKVWFNNVFKYNNIYGYK